MLDIEDFRKAAEDGLVKRVVSGSFELFKYTHETTTARAWNETTLEARGIVFQDGKLVARPMRKFFNSHEPESVFAGGLQPEVALVKLDGTCINAWFDFDGNLQVSTNGSLDNEYIDGAKYIISEHQLEGVLRQAQGGMLNWCCSFEYTYPQGRFEMPSIISHSRERLTAINMRARSGSELSAAYMDYLNKQLYDDPNCYYNLSITIENPSLLSHMEKLAKHLPYTDEGWVLSSWVDSHNQRVKVKGSQYVAMHRVIHGMTDRRVADAWYVDVCADLCNMLHEPHKTRLAEQFLEYDTQHIRAVTDTNEWIAGWIAAHGQEFERRDFVIDAQRDIPNYWQLAINQHFNGSADFRLWVVKKITGKSPRTWAMPMTDDTPEEMSDE